MKMKEVVAALNIQAVGFSGVGVECVHPQYAVFSLHLMLESAGRVVRVNALGVESWELSSEVVVPEVIVDIRTAEQFRKAHLHGAINLTYNDFQLKILQTIESKESVLLVDGGGARAAEMAVWLRGHGVPAQYLVGGMAAWRGPLEKA